MPHGHAGSRGGQAHVLGNYQLRVLLVVGATGFSIFLMPRLLAWAGHDGATFLLEKKAAARKARAHQEQVDGQAAAGSRFDVILVAGGGQTADGPPAHVKLRLEKAVELYEKQAPRPFIITTGRGTWYKPCPMDPRGFEITEAKMNAEWLLEHGVAPAHILMETSAMETIGNAYYSRVTHTDPMGASRIAVINNRWHMPRTRAVFEHVFSLRPLPPNIDAYSLTFIEVGDGISKEALKLRLAKEDDSLPRFVKGSHWQAETSTLKEMHRWFNVNHDAYSCTGQNVERVADPKLIQTY